MPTTVFFSLDFKLYQYGLLNSFNFEAIIQHYLSLWLKEDFRSNVIEGCILEIGLGKIKYSLNIYLNTNIGACMCVHKPKTYARG